MQVGPEGACAPTQAGFSASLTNAVSGPERRVPFMTSLSDRLCTERISQITDFLSSIFCGQNVFHATEK